MKFSTQQILRAAVVLALGAASASSFAQSTEYRRGYDAGYGDGVRAAQGGGGRGGDRWNLRIEEATYGVRGASCDARRAVREEAERNRNDVRVGNQLCGDPARGAQKRLFVTYRCGDGDIMRASGREDEVLHLSCRR
ncbi:MAG TPA: hypothetical protein VFR42_02925 [Candidatus Acidoferrum sp.]|nr:hypothetical protein [Candidatus Acidoferrum sp.]